MINLANQLFFIEEKNPIYKLTRAIFKEHDFCEQTMKKHFDKNLIRFVKNEESSDKCWICNNFIA